MSFSFVWEKIRFFMFNVFSGRLKTDIIDEKESLRTVGSRGLFLEISLREFEFVF